MGPERDISEENSQKLQRSNLEESVELWGECFSRSKFGLNEEQVKTFIGRLISEREILLERDKQFKTLALRAERIIAEADIIANEIRLKAEKDAQAQAHVILERAREQADQLIEQKRVEMEAFTASTYAAIQKRIREIEEEATVQAKTIIMRALAESNKIIKQKRAESQVVAIEEVDIAKSDILANAQRRLKEVEEAAEAQAQIQAQAILSSNRIPKDH